MYRGALVMLGSGWLPPYFGVVAGLVLACGVCYSPLPGLELEQAMVLGLARLSWDVGALGQGKSSKGRKRLSYVSGEVPEGCYSGGQVSPRWRSP